MTELTLENLDEFHYKLQTQTPFVKAVQLKNPDGFEIRFVFADKVFFIRQIKK